MTPTPPRPVRPPLRRRPPAPRRGRGGVVWAVALAAFAVALVADASAQTVASGPLALSVDAETGALGIAVDGPGEHGTTGSGFAVDGQVQGGFREVGRDPLVLENGAVRLTMEPAGERAVVATWETLDGAARELDLRLDGSNGARYYGTGERFHALDHRGYLVPMRSDDRLGNKGVGSHKPVPFYMSTEGYGVWLDTFEPSLFDLNGTDRLGTHLQLRASRLRAVFFGGPTLAQTLGAFTALTGRPPVPPPWAFGLWKSRDVHHNRDSVLVDVENHRALDVPASVLVLDSPWAVGYNDFQVNRQQFSDPESMFRRIDALGFALCLWLTPYVNAENVQDAPGVDAETSTFAEAAAAGYLAGDGAGGVAMTEWWKGTGGLVDFTNPAAVEWWHGQLDKVRWTGVRAWKVDGGEGNFVPADAAFHDGTPAEAMRNRYGALYDSTMQAYVDGPMGGDGVLLTRPGYTGSGRYPFDWAGDNRSNFSAEDGLRSVVVAGQNAALSGMPLWGHDIAGYISGFDGPPSPELFVRWAQVGAFSPLMQVHMTTNMGPWDFGPEALAGFRKYAKLRTTLFPYLYDAVHEASREGTPVIRPMAYAFPDDDRAARERYQYLFGPDLLVAPVVTPGNHRAVYLPAGEWVDWWTGETFTGPQTMEVEAPMDVLPLYARAGSVLPALPDDVDTLVEHHDGLADGVQGLDERRVLMVMPGVGGAVETYDGIGVRLSESGGRTTLTVSAEDERPVEVRLRFRDVDVDTPPGVTVRPDGPDTVVDLPAVSAPVMLSWTE